MKKIVSLSCLGLGVAFVNLAIAGSPTPLKSALIINNSQHPITLQYSQCTGTELCTFGSPVTIDTVKSGKNYLGVGISSSSEKFSIFSAIATDENGNTIAKIDDTCSLSVADKNGVIILNDYDSPRIVCQYGE